MTETGVRSSCETAGDELHLLPRETLVRARAVRGEHRDAREHEQQDAEAERPGCASRAASTAASSDPARCRATSVHARLLSNGSGLPLGSVAGRRDMLMNRLRRRSAPVGIALLSESAARRTSWN